MSYRYPKSVPVLTADDICKGSLRDNGHSCILGWLGVTFLPIKREELGVYPFRELRVWCDLPDAVQDATVRQCQEKIGKTSGDVAAENDDSKLADIAAWFNRITASLGYVVGNPEATNLKGDS